MKALANALASCLLLLLVVFPFWACSNEGELTAQVKQQIPEGSMKVGTTKVSGNLDIECGDNDFSDVVYQCRVTVTGTVNGAQVTKTIDVSLKTKCAPHKRIRVNCDDPLLLQMPADAYAFTCTWTAPGGASGPMDIIPGLASVPIGDGALLLAEPGTQIVIIAYPETLPDGYYDVSLGFSLGFSRPIAVKGAIAARMSCDETVVYPPMVPCGLTDFATLPAVMIPVAPVPVPITIPLDGVPDACIVDIDVCPLTTGVTTPQPEIESGSWGHMKTIYR